MIEYDLFTKGRRYPDTDDKDSSIGHYDAVSVQLCRDAGLDDATIDALLRRISLRADVENARLRMKLAEQNLLIESIGQCAANYGVRK